MADIRTRKAFRDLADAVEALLAERGLAVAPDGIDATVVRSLRVVAASMDVTETQALRLLVPAQVAALIEKAAREMPGAERPVRNDEATLPTTVCIAGLLLMGLGQVVKVASTCDPRTADRAGDLICEFGQAMFDIPAEETDVLIEVPRGVIAETARVLDLCAEHLESGAWKLGPPGGRAAFGLEDLNAHLAARMRDDADNARRFLANAILADQR